MLPALCLPGWAVVYESTEPCTAVAAALWSLPAHACTHVLAPIGAPGQPAAAFTHPCTLPRPCAAAVLAVYVFALAFPFYAAINSLMYGLVKPLMSYSVPCLAYLAYYSCEENRLNSIYPGGG